MRATSVANAVVIAEVAFIRAAEAVGLRTVVVLAKAWLDESE